VKARIDPSPSLLALAGLQGGVVTLEQAGEHGLGRHSIARLVSAGAWQRLDTGVFCVREPDWLGLAWAGVLIGGETARIGGLAAAHLHGLSDEPPDSILVHVDSAVRRRDRPPWFFRRELPGKQSGKPRGAPPRITVEDLILDLVDNRSDDPYRRSAAHWASAAVQRRLTTRRRLSIALAGRRMIHDRRGIEEILADVGDGAESPLELRYLSDVERAHGLPKGHRQSVRRPGRFESTVRVFRDVFYDAFGLVVELDGRLGHRGDGRLRDLRRDNTTTLRGERTLRYGWLDVSEEPCLTAFQVAAGLALGGWNGTPRRCQRCRDVPDSVLVELGAG
jgi:hypothetical protein